MIQDRFSVYITRDDQRRIEQVAQVLTAQHGVLGLYHANGSVNRSAILSYLLRHFAVKSEEYMREQA